MDALNFFQAVLPAEGTYFLVIFKPGKNGPAHKAFESLEALAAAVGKSEAEHPDWSIYHACASYKEAFVEVDGKKKYRVAQNLDRAKAFWVDIDCGEEKASSGLGYANKKEAVTKLSEFCTNAKLPQPMLIDSGNGIHAYWPLTKDVSAPAWRRVAPMLKALFSKYGLLVDPSRTADFASILRPVGSFNKKGGARKQVVCRKEMAPIDPVAFYTIVKSALGDTPVDMPVSNQSLADNDDLIAHTSSVSNIPTSAHAVAARCNQLAEIRDLGGAVGYDLWRGMIGVTKHCVEGIEVAQLWSKNHDDYSEGSTQAKYDSWETPPPTCNYFAKYNPQGCNNCPHKGKIKTPMVLGRDIDHKEKLVVDAQVDGTLTAFDIPEFPNTYKYNGGNMVRYIKDKDDIWHEIPFSPNLFYPISRVRKEDGEFSIGVRMHLPDNRVREFALDTSLLASPQKLMDYLGRYELFSSLTKDAPLHMTAYLREYLERLKTEAEEVNTMTNFGWKDDYSSFLIGDRLYHRDGTVRKVLTGGYARDKESSFPAPKGSTKGYAEAINTLYNHKGLEYRQYVIGSVFGSILTPLGDSLYKGLLLAITGTATAKGKTTLCHAALYAFGDAGKMTIKSEKGATLNARNARMGTYNNIPFLFDEITHIDPEDFSQLAYTISLGEEKDRLTMGRGQTRMAPSSNWAMSPLATANTDLHSILAGRGDTQAEAVRLIQIRVDQYSMHELSSGEVVAAMKKIELNAGCAGEDFVKYVTTKLDDVLELMSQWSKRVEKDIPDSKYRLYRSHAVCTLTAVEITNMLGITQFDLGALYAFTLELMAELAEVVAEKNTISPEEALNRMINDLSPRTITTTEYRDARDGRGPEETKYNNNKPAVARYITGSQMTKDKLLAGKLFIARKEVYTWSDSCRVDPKVMLSYAKSAGLLVDWKEKFTIGRGTIVSTGNVNVICIDYDKLQSMHGSQRVLTATTSPSTVHHLPTVSTK